VDDTPHRTLTIRLRIDANFVRRWLPLTRFVTRLMWRPRIDGLERLPTDRPYLLVANHSGGLGLAELTSFGSLWLTRFGTTRALAGAAHPLGFRVPGLRTIHARLGTVPSTREAMLETLRAGVPVLVFPGGDHEAFRPVWQAARVDFGGRCGFARIAFEAGVEIYPLAISGGAWTAPMLWRSTWLLPRLWVWPHLAGVKRWPLSLAGLLGAAGIVFGLTSLGQWRWVLAAAWMASPLSLVPSIPASITMRVGEPIAPEPDPRALAARVESALQSLVAAGRRWSERQRCGRSVA